MLREGQCERKCLFKDENDDGFVEIELEETDNFVLVIAKKDGG